MATIRPATQRLDMRLAPEDRASLERLRAHWDLDTISAVVRRLVRDATRRLPADSPTPRTRTTRTKGPNT